MRINAGRMAFTVAAASAIAVLALLVLRTSSSHAGEAPIGNGDGGITLSSIGTFQAPVYTAFAPGQPTIVYVVEQAGTVQAVVNGVVQSQPFLDIRSLTGKTSCNGSESCGEQGLLSIAFDPGYQTNGEFFAYFTNTDGDPEIAEFHANSATDADESSVAKVLSVRHRFATNHNGGTVMFGPDGYLYAGFGDGGIADDPHQKGQDKGSLLAKLIRIDVAADGTGAYTKPPSNPYVGKKGLDPIVAIGLRNPFRFSFDPLNGHITIGDVGQNQWEEIDYERRRELPGMNFGWDRWEGNHLHQEAGVVSDTPKRADAQFPIRNYSHANACSITGGTVVANPALTTLYGRYLYADYCAGDLRSEIPTLQKAEDDHPVGVHVTHPTSFTQSPETGDLYVSSFTGDVSRIDPAR